MADAKPLVIRKGETFSRAIRWEAPPYIYKAITAIAASAPIRITAPNHSLLDGWRVCIESVKGMTQANTKNPNDLESWPKVSVVDSDTVEINEINASEFGAYVSGGVLKFNDAVDLAGYTARMSIRAKVGGVELVSLTTENGRIILDNPSKTITLTIPASVTAMVDAKKGVYDLELVSGTGEVYRLVEGPVSITREVTT